jgi:glycosyltransferase involved in cell wall biosynthesis
MKICFLCVEIFAWGKYGGFGRATRTIGAELIKRGIEVFAIVPRREGQKPVEMLDGITVLSFRPHSPREIARLCRECDADIYHSEEPSLMTVIAMRAMPDRKHLITYRDPRDLDDWITEFNFPSYSRWQVLANYCYENNILIKKTVKMANGHFCPAKSLIPKAQSKYHLRFAPRFLPTPVMIPQTIQKAVVPTVCFVSRWDRRKRPELFFDLAAKFPEIRFIAIGRSRDPEWEKECYSRYGNVKNLQMLGFVDQFRSKVLSQVLEESWIYVNTSLREGLPNAFLEAAAHQCAILSAVDTDQFASQFGFHALEDNFEEGLRFLLEANRWQEAGRAAHEYVKNNFETKVAIDQHIDVYKEVLESPIDGMDTALP